MASQRELVKLFRNIARTHKVYLPPVLSGALNNNVKNKWQLAFQEFSKLKQAQEKQSFQEEFVSKWKAYLASVKEIDAAKDFAQYIKVIVDEKATLNPQPLPPRYRDFTADQKQQLMKVQEEMAIKRSQDLREYWKNSQDELKDVTQKDLDLIKESLEKKGTEKDADALIQRLVDAIKNGAFLNYTLPLFRVSPPSSPLDPILTPNQLKQHAKNLEQVQKMTSEGKFQKPQLDKEWIERNETLLFSTRTPEEKAKLEEKLKGLTPEQRNKEVTRMLSVEYMPIALRYKNEKIFKELQEWPEEKRKKFLEENEVLLTAQDSILDHNRKTFDEAVNLLLKTVDPNGEKEAELNKMDEEEKAYFYEKMRDIVLPNGWNSFVEAKLTDPEYVKVLQTRDPYQIKQWVQAQQDPKKLEKENEKLLQEILHGKPSSHAH